MVWAQACLRAAQLLARHNVGVVMLLLRATEAQVQLGQTWAYAL